MISFPTFDAAVQAMAAGNISAVVGPQEQLLYTALAAPDCALTVSRNTLDNW
jgi:ABC-type amino acid transport substrate-binding protein